MNKRNRYLFLIILLLISKIALAQDAAMADTLRANGKIYVVVLIILIILLGLIVYLFLLDKKLNKIEKMIHEKHKTK